MYNCIYDDNIVLQSPDGQCPDRLAELVDTVNADEAVTVTAIDPFWTGLAASAAMILFSALLRKR